MSPETCRKTTVVLTDRRQRSRGDNLPRAEPVQWQGTVGPNGSGQGSPNTEILSLPSETFGSERLTGALLDRLTHHVHILEMNGESFRLNHSRARK